MWPNLKQKVRAVLPKPILIVYIGMSQKSFLPDPSPKKSPFTFQFSIPNFKILNFQFTNFLIPNFRIPNFQIPNVQSPKI